MIAPHFAVLSLIVVLHHSPFVDGQKSAFLHGGGLFVDFFFILSGFVMTNAYGSRVAAGMPFLQFAGLRLARLYPLHLAMLLLWLAYVLAKLLANQTLGMNQTLGDEVGPYTFGLNLLLLQAMGLADSLSWNGPSWSISVEFFTYLVFYAVFRCFRAPRPALLLLASLAAYSALAGLSDPALHDGILVTYDYGFIRCIGGFFAGSALFLLRDKLRAPQDKRVSTVLQLCVIGAIIGLVARSNNSIPVQVLAIAAFVLCIHGMTTARSFVVDLLQTRPLAYIGKISFSIYMVHALVFVVAQNVFEYGLKVPVSLSVGRGIKQFDLGGPMAFAINCLLVGLIIGLARLTWTHVEQPGQRFWRNRTLRNRR